MTLTHDASVKAVVDARNAAIVRGYQDGRIDDVARHFCEDAWQMPPHQPPLAGREAIRAYWKNAVTWGRWTLSLQAEDVQVSGEMAAERGSYTLDFQAAAGAPMPSFSDRGNYVVVWRRDADGEWRILLDAPVSVVPFPA